jgi:hypothetical protein
LKKYGSKAPLKKLKEREGNTTAFSKLAERIGIDEAPKRCLTILNRKADRSNNEKRNYAAACPLCRDFEGARQVFVSSDFSSSFLHVFF